MKVGAHKYKGIAVWYNQHEETWECFLERSRMPEIDNARLNSIYKSIDNFLKEENNFDRFEALVVDGRLGRPYEFEQRTVTSMPQENIYWTVDEKGKRSQENGRNLICVIPSNLRGVDQIKEVRNKIAGLIGDVDDILAKITLVPR